MRDNDYTKLLQDHYLEDLVKEGDLKSYTYATVYEDKCMRDIRSTERITLELPSGKKLIIDSFCSGSAENTVLCIDKESNSGKRY